MAASVQKQLRHRSLVLLGLVVAMLFSGMSFLKPHLVGWIFVVYWLVCLTLTCTVIIVAMLELRAIRRYARRAHLELFITSLGDIKSSEPKITDNKNNDKNLP